MAGALTRDAAIFALTPAADQTGKEGYAVKIVAGEAAISTAHNGNFGVILDGETTSGKSTIASMAGASGTVKVKLSGTVALGDKLMIHTDGTWKAHTSTNNVSGMAMEAGTATELVEAALVAGYSNV
jgi:hypothetical protein